jgi:undecaprenyl-diphosphatase
VDLKIVEAVQKIETEFLDGLFSLLTRFGEEIFFICTFLILYWCLGYNKAFKFAFFYVCSVLINGVIKAIVKRPRPWMASNTVENKLPASGLSFPSGHSQSVSAISTFVVYDIYKNKNNKKWLKITALIIAIILCLTVGFTRLYLGQHYLTDVLAGLTLGVALMLLLNFIVAKIPENLKNKINLEIVLAILSLIMLLAVVIVGMFDLGLSYKTTLKLFRYAAMAIGVSLGYILSKRTIVEVYETIFIKLIKVAIGFVVTFGLYALLCIIPQTNLFVVASCILVVAVVATFVYPYIFNLILRKIKKD